MLAPGGIIVIGVASSELRRDIADFRFRGSIVGIDEDTGEELWRRPVSEGADGAGSSVWSSAAIDGDRGLAYIGNRQAYEQPASRLSDSLLALHYDTGELEWHRQFTAGDAWTYFSPPPVGDQDLVGVGDKAGTFDVFDRDTGETVWAKELTQGSPLGGVMVTAAYAGPSPAVTVRAARTARSSSPPTRWTRPSWPRPTARPTTRRCSPSTRLRASHLAAARGRGHVRLDHLRRRRGLPAVGPRRAPGPRRRDRRRAVVGRAGRRHGRRRARRRRLSAGPPRLLVLRRPVRPAGRRRRLQAAGLTGVRAFPRLGRARGQGPCMLLPPGGVLTRHARARPARYAPGGSGMLARPYRHHPRADPTTRRTGAGRTVTGGEIVAIEEQFQS